MPWATVADENDRFIEVHGQSQMELVPDEIHVRLRLMSQEFTIRAAEKNLSGVVEKTLKHAKKFQKNSKRIKTDVFSVTPQYELNKEFKGYRAVTHLTIVFTEEDAYYRFMHKLPSVAEDHSVNVQFKLSKLGDHQIELEKLALKDAQHRAETLVKTMGGSLGALLQVKDIRVDGINRAHSMQLMRAESGRVAMEPGSRTVRGYATVRYEIK
jgi:uncharacterized protein YggE